MDSKARAAPNWRITGLELNQATRDHFLPLLFTCCVTPGKLLNLSVLQFPPWKLGLVTVPEIVYAHLSTPLGIRRCSINIHYSYIYLITKTNIFPPKIASTFFSDKCHSGQTRHSGPPLTEEFDTL